MALAFCLDLGFMLASLANTGGAMVVPESACGSAQRFAPSLRPWRRRSRAVGQPP